MNTSTLSDEVVNAFFEAFAVLPQRVVWKFENEIPGLSGNVFTSSWLPQQDILGRLVLAWH
jgi:UDP:flavonoid glycosyltransferase YjiC (YdhE family)